MVRGNSLILDRGSDFFLVFFTLFEEDFFLPVFSFGSGSGSAEDFDEGKATQKRL